MIQMKSKVSTTILMFILMFNLYGQSTTESIKDTLSLQVHDSIQETLLSRTSDSLNGYLNEPLFGIIDTSVQSQYPFIHFDRNHYQFYTKESPQFEHLFFKLQQMVRSEERRVGKECRSRWSR